MHVAQGFPLRGLENCVRGLGLGQVDGASSIAILDLHELLFYLGSAFVKNHGVRENVVDHLERACYRVGERCYRLPDLPWQLRLYLAVHDLYCACNGTRRGAAPGGSCSRRAISMWSIMPVLKMAGENGVSQVLHPCRLVRGWAYYHASFESGTTKRGLGPIYELCRGHEELPTDPREQFHRRRVMPTQLPLRILDMLGCCINDSIKSRPRRYG